MRPIKFKGYNIVIAEDQEEYLDLPAFIDSTDQMTKERRVVMCWRPSLVERIKILFTGKVWQTVLTFGHPLQPQIIDTKRPYINKERHNKE